MKKLLYLLIILIIQQASFGATPRKNDLREQFINNQAIFYTINMRTFSAKDYNGNDIIEPELGEETGTFIGAIKRLDEIKSLGINTIYLLPITKTGKLKALGNAGSLYAIDSFNEISPYLDYKNNNLSAEEEAKLFVEEAHKRNLSVIIDLPSCGSYDFSLTKPDLFLKDKEANSIVPSDWTDVRLFKVYNKDGSLNDSLIQEYKDFIDLAQKLGLDGIRADVAAIKPRIFWEKIISYAREKNPNFLFIAEASTSWKNPSKPYTEYESVKNLLLAGFDGYYTDFANYKDITTKKEFIKKIKTDKKLLKKFAGKKSQLITISTHDQQSPVYDGGKDYWEKVLWTNMTYSGNPYFLDGFPSGDRYEYQFENKKAYLTKTDDDFYFIHKGKMDIFNFSRQPINTNNEYLKEFEKAMKFKNMSGDIITNGTFKLLKTNSKEILAYSTEKNQESVISVFNLSQNENHKSIIYVKKMNKKRFLLTIKGKKEPIVKRGKIILDMKPNDIYIFVFSKEKI